MTHIETKFGLGDAVWRVERRRLQVQAPCGFCAGRGRVTGRDMSERPCPARCRDGYVIREGSTAWTVGPRLTVGLVEVALCASAQYAHERYMCVETGVGSGHLHSVEDLFAFYVDASAECARRNADVSTPVDF